MGLPSVEGVAVAVSYDQLRSGVESDAAALGLSAADGFSCCSVTLGVSVSPSMVKWLVLATRNAATTDGTPASLTGAEVHGQLKGWL